MSEVTVTLGDPNTPEALAMIAALNAATRALYDQPACHFLGAGRLSADDADFFVASIDGRIAGMGALIALDEQALEVKRMWTEPWARRMGVAGAILSALETRARERGARFLRLETGTAQAQAQALYEREGFERRPPFPPYDAHPQLIFMEKRVTDAGEVAA